MLPNIPGVVILRWSFGHRQIRETVIVSGSNQMDPAVGIFAKQYGQEGTWLEWALEVTGYWRLDTLYLPDHGET